MLYVLEGQLETELRDGSTFKLVQGMSYQVSDFGDAALRSSTKTGAKLLSLLSACREWGSVPVPAAASALDEGLLDHEVARLAVAAFDKATGLEHLA